MAAKRVSSLSLCAILLLTGSASAAAEPSLEQVYPAPLNPEFVAWQKQIAAGEIGVQSEEASWGGHIPSPVDRSHLRPATGISAQAALPSSYTLRPQYVTSVKDQGNCGACWAFATYGSLESWLLKNKGEPYDFSENHLKAHSGFDEPPCKGGNTDMSTAYLVRWEGPVAESDDPYHDTNDLSSPGGPVRKYVLSVLTFVQRDGNRDEIKGAVMTYGALKTSMYWDWDLYRSDTNTYYYGGDTNDTPTTATAGGHDVDIVGWDDNKVVPGAPQKGAWLVKSSWGADLGDGGYTHVSYYDTKAAQEAMAFCDAVPTSTYATNYYYDKLGHCSSVGVTSGKDYLWGANVFPATADGYLVAVGFYALSENTAYEISVYGTVTPVGATAVSFSNALTATTSGTAPYSGYHSVSLSSAVPLRQGDRFAIVVKVTTPNYRAPLAIEIPIQGHSSQASANPGESYWSSTGVQFNDLTASPGYEEASVCIRGLTVAPSGGGGQALPSDLVEVPGAPYAPMGGLAAGSQAAQDRQKQAVAQLTLPLEVKTKQTAIVFRLVPAGSFTMGSPSSEADRDSDEGPAHQVTLTKAFYCGKFEVTQSQWQQVMGSNSNLSYFKSAGLDAPVEQVTWLECQDFVAKLCQKEGVANGTYRLLMEAEWEYACRAGTQTAYCFGDYASVLGDYAWYGINSGSSTHLVGQKKPNAWGLYDMHGNVYEWCQDEYSSAYIGGAVTDPLGPASGVDRVDRGGSWYGLSRDCRSANRVRDMPGNRYINVGLRLIRGLTVAPSGGGVLGTDPG